MSFGNSDHDSIQTILDFDVENQPQLKEYEIELGVYDRKAYFTRAEFRDTYKYVKCHYVTDFRVPS